MKHGDRLVMFDSLKFYRAVKSSCMQRGTTQLRAVIYATLALEEIMRDPSCPDRIPVLATIGAVAIPEMERLSPMDEQEETDRACVIDYYETKDPSKFNELFDKWKRAKQNLNIERRNQNGR